DGDGLTEAGLLGDDRLTGGQIVEVPLAEPAAPQADILVLGDGELRAGAPEVGWILPEDVLRELERADHAPPVPLQVLGVAPIVGLQRQLERLRSAPRQVEELLPFMVLAPAVDLAVVLHVPAFLAVVPDGREEPRLR